MAIELAQPVLNANLSVPVVEGHLPSIDLNGLLDLMEATPLLDEWVSSVGHVRASAMIGENGFDRQGRQWQRRSLKGGLSKARAQVDKDDWSALSVVGVAMDQNSPFGYWSYNLDLGFASSADTGRYLDRWGGLSLTITSPDLASRIQAGWADHVMQFMTRGSKVLSALLGYSCLVDGSKAMVPLEGYALRNYPLPPVEPETIPGIQWIFILPPSAVTCLGGWEQVRVGMPAYACEPVVHRDGRIGALVQITATPGELNAQTRERVLAYLGAVAG